MHSLSIYNVRCNSPSRCPPSRSATPVNHLEISFWILLMSPLSNFCHTASKKKLILRSWTTPHIASAKGPRLKIYFLLSAKLLFDIRDRSVRVRRGFLHSRKRESVGDFGQIPDYVDDEFFMIFSPDQELGQGRNGLTSFWSSPYCLDFVGYWGMRQTAVTAAHSRWVFRKRRKGM